MVNNDELGDLAIVVGIIFAILAPICWVIEKLIGEKVYKVDYYYYHTNFIYSIVIEDYESLKVFKAGLELYKKQGIIKDYEIKKVRIEK